jgi:PAS domain S-box-containing protein
MKISSKILSLQFVMVCFIIIIMLAFYRLADRMESGFDALEYRTLPVLFSLEKIHADGFGIFGSTNRAMVYKHIIDHPEMAAGSHAQNKKSQIDLYRELSEIDKQINGFNINIEEYGLLVERFFPGEIGNLEQIRKSSRDMISSGKEMIAIKAMPGNIKKIQDLERRHDNAKHQFDKVIRLALSQEAAEVWEHHEFLEYTIANIELYLFFAGAFLLIVGTLLGIYISRSIVEPLQQLARITQNPDTGWNILELTAQRKDEIGTFAISFLEMLHNQQSAKDALHNQLNFQKSLFGAIPSPIFYKDVQGRYKGGNKSFAAYLGKSKTEFIDKTVYDIAAKDIADVYHDADQALFANPGLQIYESQITRSDGSVREVIFHKATYHDHLSNEVAGLVGVIMDVTELKEAQKREQTANRAKSQFLAHMSHEIRTPLNSILGMNELLAELVSDPDQIRYIQTANRAGESLLALITDILDLSKIEAGQLVLDSDIFTLSQLIHKSMDIQQNFAREQGLTMALTLAPELPEQVQGDQDRLQQIILNLLNNAIKFTHNGKITFSVWPEGEGFITFQVVDTGIGMTKEAMDQIFQPFVQADSSTTRHYGGTGLGLTICRNLVEAMGGRLTVESKVGEGSCFTVSIPLLTIRQQPSAPAKIATVLEEVEQPRINNMVILAVDDTEENLMVITAFLRNTPYQVLTAEDGAEAVKIFKSQPVDMVIMDLLMPILDGYEATRVIRAWENEQGRQPVPIIAFTALALKKDLDKALEVGCNYHLTKPIKKATLLKTIERFKQTGE